MNNQIQSPVVLSIIDNIIKFNKTHEVSREVSEHLLYVMFRRIKQTYSTYATNNPNLHIVHAYENYLDRDVDFELSPYEYESFVNEFMCNIETFNNTDDFCQFLQKYFIFVPKTLKGGISTFIKEFIDLADTLSGSATTHLIQTSYIDDFIKVHEVKKKTLSFINDKLNTNIDFIDFHINANGEEIDLGMSFLFYFDAQDKIDDIINKNLHKDLLKHELILKQFYVNKFLKNNGFHKCKHKIAPIDNSLIYGPPYVKKRKKFKPLYALLLDSNYCRDRNLHRDKTKFECVKTYNIAASESLVMIEKWQEKEFLKNKLILKGTINFSYEQYFDLLFNQLSLFKVKATV